jgi:hypothetical protein
LTAGNGAVLRPIRAKVILIRHGASLICRRLTARSRVLPQVFILGATKAGSSSLSHMLWQHPAHVLPFTKELMYLQYLPNFTSNWEFSRASSFLWGRYKDGHAKYAVPGYRKFFPMRHAMRQRQREVGHAFTSDCDPFNLYCDVAIQRIFELNVDPKFIISLREPVARAYSDFNMHATRVGDRRSFAEAIDQELDGTETRFRKRFLNQSVYAPRLERWFEAFSRDRFLIVRAEDLFRNSEEIARQMFSFLGLSPVPIDSSPKNVGRYGRGLDKESAQRLREYFRPHNEHLYRLLGYDMGWD